MIRLLIDRMNRLVVQVQQTDINDLQDVTLLCRECKTEIQATVAKCRSLQPLLKNYLIYTAIGALSTAVGVGGYYLSSDPFETPLWSLISLITTAVVFLILITQMGFVNIAASKLNDAITDHLFHIELLQAENNRDGRGLQNLSLSANLLSALSNVDKELAHIFGISVTPQTLTTIWSKALFAIFISVQYAVFVFGEVFTLRYMPFRVLQQSENIDLCNCTCSQ